MHIHVPVRLEWKTVMSRFQREVKLIEDEANSFIDQSFQSLRSAEGAFDMLHNFKNIRARDAINATMMKKFNDILSTFEKEVDSINNLFEDNKRSPPISKTQPPVAGAISWSRSLFQRIKHTVLRFQTMKELIDSEAGKAVSIGYGQGVGEILSCICQSLSVYVISPNRPASGTWQLPVQ